MTPGNGQHAHATGHYHPRRPLWLRALHRGGQVWDSSPDMNMSSGKLLYIRGV
jgi:hypothetical protein